MIAVLHFLAGAVGCTYVIAAVFFLKFWHRTRDRLFLSFAGAFLLLAINLIIVECLDAKDERTGLVYLLRVVGFLLILDAIVRKNTKNTAPYSQR